MTFIRMAALRSILSTAGACDLPEIFGRTEAVVITGQDVVVWFYPPEEEDGDDDDLGLLSGLGTAVGVLLSGF